MPPPPGLRDAIDAVRRWHATTTRDLPWRTDGTSPWGILVSEVMTQQTQAERAAPRWRSFMDRFPTVHEVADADVGEVIDEWAGLGYNRRAVSLHAAARAVVDDHGGQVPDDLDGLLALPGVGPYTARAVLAFAHGRDVVPVDTNVARVLARLTATVLDRPTAQDWADEVATYADGPGIATALMDFGAGTCTARAPSCTTCPVAPRCAWAGEGPDPAASGAHRPRPQGRFEGSARQARGRLVAAMRTGPVPHADALALAGDHGEDLLAALVADGLARQTADGFALPRSSHEASG